MTRRIVISAALVMAAGIGLTACGAKAAAPTSTAPASASTTTTTAPATVPTVTVTTQAATTTTKAPTCTNMSVGKSDWCEMEGYEADDSTVAKFDVWVTAVVDPASPDNSFDAAPSGQRIVGVVLQIKGVSGSYSDDVNSAVTLVGNNGQTYQPSFGGMAGYTNYNSGSVTAIVGANLIGAVTFDVPNGVKIALVNYSPNDGMGATATWK